jgi:proteasome lid subunit RPN8/RPN11
MVRLQISSQDMLGIERHALAVYPEECCGLLVGEPASPGRDAVVVRQVWSAENVAERRQSRYAIAPEALLRGHHRAREKGLEVIGYYHSHPQRGAQPSDFDRLTAWPETLYLILSMAAGRVAEARCWHWPASGAGCAEVKIGYS